MVAMKSKAAWVLALCVPLVVAGCAAPETGPSNVVSTPAVYERADTPTGSNLPRKAGRPSAVIEADKDAVAGAARGATRNPGPTN